MTLSTNSNTINTLGIFGRMSPKDEEFFQELEKKYSTFPNNEKSKDFFNHLSLVINNNITVNEIANYLNLLKALKPYLPLKIKISSVILIDEEHLALSFDINQTKEIRNLIKKYVSKGIIETHYTKVVWHVSKENQEKVKKELEKIKEMTFFNFILVANKQNEANTIYSSNKYI